MQSIVKVFGMEMAIYGQISDEEWEAIRLTKRERRDNVNQFIRTKLVDSKMCSACLRWNLLAVETWAMRYRHAALKMAASATTAADENAPAVVIDPATIAKPLVQQVATWEPTNGMLSTDVLFPHVAHGFRGLMLPVVAYHVRIYLLYNFYYRYYVCFLMRHRIHRGKCCNTTMPVRLSPSAAS